MYKDMTKILKDGKVEGFWKPVATKFKGEYRP